MVKTAAFLLITTVLFCSSISPARAGTIAFIPGTQLANIGAVQGPDQQYSIAFSQGETDPLMLFDVSGFAGDIVVSPATLTLTVGGIWPGNFPLIPMLEVVALAGAYDPNTVSALPPLGTVLDTQNPAIFDFGNRASGATVTFNISASQVQSWIDSAATNFGVVIREPAYSDTVGHSDIAWQLNPTLSVDLTPEPASFGLASASLLALFFAGRKLKK